MARKAPPNPRQDVSIILRAALRLPLSGARVGLGIAGSDELASTAWEGYDASIRLASASIDALYADPRFGDVASGAIKRWLRWQRFGAAFRGAALALVWRSLGLATAADMHALHAEIRSLGERLRVQRDLAAPRPTRIPPAREEADVWAEW